MFRQNVFESEFLGHFVFLGPDAPQAYHVLMWTAFIVIFGYCCRFCFALESVLTSQLYHGIAWSNYSKFYFCAVNYRVH